MQKDMYASAAWRSVESFVYSFLAGSDARLNNSGAITQIDDYLASDTLKTFLGEIGVLSAGYLFDASWDKTFRFFVPDEHSSQHYKTPYLWNNQDIGDQFSEFLHSLFLVVRTEQLGRLKSQGHHFEEYYVRLPQIRSGPSSDDLAHYCPVGELLFWLYAWRLLWYFENLVPGESAFEAGRVSLDDTCPNRNEIQWRGVKVAHDALNLAIENLALDDWAAEYRALCLYSPATGRNTAWVGAVGQYLWGDAARASEFGDDLPALDLILQEAVVEWLHRTVPNSDRHSAGSARLWMEAHAPAPLLPFYFWIGLDQQPKTYLACPVWSSPLYPAKVLKERIVIPTPIVGLALSGVCPLTAWDSTLTEELQQEEFGVRDTSKRDVIEILRLLGQPAVDLNYYTALGVELEKAERIRVTAMHAHVLRRGLIHEIGQLGAKILLWTRDTPKKQEIRAECTVLKRASEALCDLLDPASDESYLGAQEVFEAVQRAFEYHKFELDLLLPPPENVVDCDIPTPLKYVVIELCRNAYRYCDPTDGRKAVRISCTTDGTESGNILSISVRQPGSIDPDFTLDTRRDPVPKEPAKGLPVVHYIVSEILRGWCEVRQDGKDVLAYVEWPPDRQAPRAHRWGQTRFA